MFINTRYSTIYAIQKDQRIRAISERESDERSRWSFNAEFENSSEKSKMDYNESQKEIVGKDAKTVIENIKFLSDGKPSRIASTVRELYEADSMRYAVESTNFMDLSDKIKEWLEVDTDDENVESSETAKKAEQSSGQGDVYVEEDFGTSKAYRETVEEKVLEDTVLKLKPQEDNELPKDLFLAEMEKERYGFNFRKIS